MCLKSWGKYILCVDTHNTDKISMYTHICIFHVFQVPSSIHAGSCDRLPGFTDVQGPKVYERPDEVRSAATCKSKDKNERKLWHEYSRVCHPKPLRNLVVNNCFYRNKLTTASLEIEPAILRERVRWPNHWTILSFYYLTKYCVSLYDKKIVIPNYINHETY